MKKCPFCAEEIQDEAIKCRFCGEFIKKRWWKNCFFNCLISLIISIALMFLFTYLSFLGFKFILYKMFFAGPEQSQHYPAFTGQGIEGILKEFAEVFRAWGERLKEFFHSGTQNYHRITF